MPGLCHRLRNTTGVLKIPCFELCLGPNLTGDSLVLAYLFIIKVYLRAKVLTTEVFKTLLQVTCYINTAGPFQRPSLLYLDLVGFFQMAATLSREIRRYRIITDFHIQLNANFFWTYFIR